MDQQDQIRVQGQERVVNIGQSDDGKIRMYYEYTEDHFRKSKDYGLLYKAIDRVISSYKADDTLYLSVKAAVYKSSQIDSDGELRPIVERASAANDIDAMLQIRVYGRNIFRVMAKRGSGRFEHHTVMVDDAGLVPMPFEVSESEQDIEITAAGSRLVITKQPFQLDMYDLKGKKLYSQANDDKVLSFSFESAPFGWIENTNTGEQAVACSSRMEHDEHFFGFGEQFSSVDKKNQEIDVFITDPLSVGSARTYLSVPFFWSTKGYGLFMNTHFRSKFFMGSRSNRSVGLHVYDDQVIDQFLFAGGEPKELLHAYTRITGRAPMVPKWSFGLWMSRCSYKSREEVEATAAALREHDIPCDVLNIDTDWFEKPWACDWEFGEQNFPKPEEMIANLGKQGFKLSLWQKPYITVELLPELTGMMREKGWLPINRYGELARANPVFDISNPEAKQWYQDKLKALFKLGVKVIKTDMGEGVPVEADYFGYGGKEMHNIYAYLYNKAAYEATAESQGEGLVWARSGYAGSQKFPVHWAGDPFCDFDGLRFSIRSGLSMGLSGFTYWSCDIGGFLGRPTAECYIRWAQAGMFMSHSRAHGAGNPREPWTFGEEAERIFRKFTKLRYSLLPYIYSQAKTCSEQGLPMMRHLMIDFPTDRWSEHIEDEWMFGDSFLVAPVLDNSDSREVYLPEGSAWHHFFTGEKYEGGRFITAYAPLDTMPLFVKAGAIIPFGPERDSIEGCEDSSLTLRVYPRDSGDSAFIYYNGASHEIAAHFSEQEIVMSLPALNCPVMVETADRVTESKQDAAGKIRLTVKR